MEHMIKESLTLRKSGKLHESNALLLKALLKNPHNAYLNYQVAWSYDILEQEQLAMSYYEKALAQGLEQTYLEDAYIGLGSTYRITGNYQKSFDLLKFATQQFPENKALSTFYAMTLFNLAKHEEAMEILLTSLATTSTDATIQEFSKAILFYSDKLTKTWE